MKIKIICPYCKKRAKLTDSSVIYDGISYGMVYLCVGYPKCDAYVGVHSNSKRAMPLGRMANKELREAKKELHRVFDKFWKEYGYTRNRAYKLLSKIMKISYRKCHIGYFDLNKCEQAYNSILKHYEKENIKKP